MVSVVEMAAEQCSEIFRALAIDVTRFGQRRCVLLRFQRGHADQQHAVRQQAVGDIAHESILVLSRNVLDLQVELPRLAQSGSIMLKRVEPLDDSLESVFGYLVEN